MLRKWLVLLIFGVPTVGLSDVSGKVRVIDGDTIDVAGVRVRLHGVDAPENDQTCETEQGMTWACGAWVTAQVGAAFDGKRAFCRQIDRDRYGRSVAKCQVDGADVGQTLVSNGWAFAYRRYSMAYDLAEKQAAVTDRGLHSSRLQNPAQHRATRAKGRIPPDRTCAIKGNISTSGRIFHVPGQSDYERTGINLSKGEQWFCSEAEAVEAGWRKARR